MLVRVPLTARDYVEVGSVYACRQRDGHWRVYRKRGGVPRLLAILASCGNKTAANVCDGMKDGRFADGLR